jgi:hypothetical protein
MDSHEWVVPPSHSAPLTPIKAPPKSLDVWRLSKNAVVRLSEPVQLCSCTAKCHIRGPNECLNHRARRECSTQCLALECDNILISGFDSSHPCLIVSNTDTKGYGVFTQYAANQPPIPSGGIVGEFAGICTASLDTMNPGYHCVVKLTSVLYLVCYGNPKDPLYKAQYINHSCAPNSEIQVWIDAQGWPRALVVARCELLNGQEVTVDYNMTQHHYGDRTVCQCGAPNCRGYIERANPVPPRLSGISSLPPTAMSSSSIK